MSFLVQHQLDYPNSDITDTKRINDIRKLQDWCNHECYIDARKYNFKNNPHMLKRVYGQILVDKIIDITLQNPKKSIVDAIEDLEWFFDDVLSKSDDANLISHNFAAMMISCLDAMHIYMLSVTVF